MSPHREHTPDLQQQSDPNSTDEIQRLTVERRRRVLEEFFTRSPGVDAHPLGLGRALFDFQEWEIESGRIDDLGGSPWWSRVNGQLVADLAATLDGALGPWSDYTSSGPTDRQSLLWAAHQDSIHRGVQAALEHLDGETQVEQEFIGLALGVVDMAAAVDFRTSSGALGRRTAELYPRCYPCTPAELDRLREELAP